MADAPQTSLHGAMWRWTGEPSLQNGDAVGQITWEGGMAPSTVFPSWLACGNKMAPSLQPGTGRAQPASQLAPDRARGPSLGEHWGHPQGLLQRVPLGREHLRSGAKWQAGGGTCGPEKQHGLLWFHAHKQMDLWLQSIDS